MPRAPNPPPKRRAPKHDADSAEAYQAQQKYGHTYWETKVRRNAAALDQRREYSRQYWKDNSERINEQRRVKRQHARAAAMSNKVQAQAEAAASAGAEASHAAVAVQQVGGSHFKGLPATLPVPADMQERMHATEIKTAPEEPMTWPSFRRSSWSALSEPTRNSYIKTGRSLFGAAGYPLPPASLDPAATGKAMLAGDTDIWHILRTLYTMKAGRGPYKGQPLLAATRNTMASALEALLIEVVRAFVANKTPGTDAGFRKAYTWMYALHAANTGSHAEADKLRKTQVRGEAQAAKFLPLDKLQAAASGFIRKLKATSSPESLRDGALLAYSAYMGNAIRNAFAQAEIGDTKPGGSDHAVRWSPSKSVLWVWVETGKGVKNARKLKETSTIDVPAVAQKMFELYAAALPAPTPGKVEYLFPGKGGKGHMTASEFGTRIGSLFEKLTGTRPDNHVIRQAAISDIIAKNPERAASDQEWLEAQAARFLQNSTDVFRTYAKHKLSPAEAAKRQAMGAAAAARAAKGRKKGGRG